MEEIKSSKLFPALLGILVTLKSVTISYVYFDVSICLLLSIIVMFIGCNGAHLEVTCG